LGGEKAQAVMAPEHKVCAQPPREAWRGRRAISDKRRSPRRLLKRIAKKTARIISGEKEKTPFMLRKDSFFWSEKKKRGRPKRLANQQFLEQSGDRRLLSKRKKTDRGRRTPTQKKKKGPCLGQVTREAYKKKSPRPKCKKRKGGLDEKGKARAKQWEEEELRTKKLPPTVEGLPENTRSSRPQKKKNVAKRQKKKVRLPPQKGKGFFRSP